MQHDEVYKNIFDTFKSVYNSGSDPLIHEVYTGYQTFELNLKQRTAVIDFQFNSSERSSIGQPYDLKREFSIPIVLYTPKTEPPVNNTLLLGAFQIFFEKREFDGVNKKSTTSFKSILDPSNQMNLGTIIYNFTLEDPISRLSEIPTLKTYQKNIATPSFDRNLRTEADEKLQTENNEDLLREEDA